MGGQVRGVMVDVNREVKLFFCLFFFLGGGSGLGGGGSGWM